MLSPLQATGRALTTIIRGEICILDLCDYPLLEGYLDVISKNRLSSIIMLSACGLVMSSALALAGLTLCASLKDIKHIVLFMQENRSFDHVGGLKSSNCSVEWIANSGSTLARWLA